MTSPRFPELSSELWRLVAQTDELASTLAVLAKSVGQAVSTAPAAPTGLGHLVVVAVHPHAPRLERVVVDWAGVVRTRDEREGPAMEVERLRAWCRRGERVHAAVGAPLPGPVAAWVGPDERDVRCGRVIAPLGAGDAGQGLLLAVAPPGAELDEAIAALMSTLPPVVATAMSRHRQRLRMRELEAAVSAGRPDGATGDDHDGLSDRVIGADGGLRPVMERAILVARSDVPVLILGETGAGKEVIARAMHAQSSRVRAPFLRVNCGAIAPELIDSELFGHEKGSFTGAASMRRGWFEQAHRGTLFLDEVGELSLAAQVRLLRILQDGELTRVGGQSVIQVDVRIIAATNRDLTTMVQQGRFREDLWYRLAVFPINLPPLRQHPEDIPAMAEFFARRAAVRFGLPVRVPTAQDLALLASYPWPGNVRELGAVMVRAVLLGQGKRLEVAKALGAVESHPLAPPAPAAAGLPGGSSAPPALTTDRGPANIASLDTAIKQHIESALRATQGRIEGPHGAAALLQVNPHTLRARMRKLGIGWARFRPYSGAPTTA